MSDVHITDKESPAQLPWFGWSAPFGAGGLFSSAYSPINLSTTHVLDAAVKTINARIVRPLSISAFVSVMWPTARSITNSAGLLMSWTDRRLRPVPALISALPTLIIRCPIRPPDWTAPSPGIKLSATTISSGWVSAFRPKKCGTLVGGERPEHGTKSFGPQSTEGTGDVHGRCRWDHRYGDVIKGGLAKLFSTPPTVVPDPNRHALTTAASATALSARIT